MSSFICPVTGMEFVEIPRGSICMVKGFGGDNNLACRVNIRPFLIGRYPVTQIQWESAMGKNPSFFKGVDQPVESVSWDKVQEFILKLGDIADVSYRLPSEAEWAYAAYCDAPTKAYSVKDTGSDERSHYAKLLMQHFEQALVCEKWHSPTQDGYNAKNVWSSLSEYKTRPIGQSKPNAFGLHDMGAIVWEWCQDMWHDVFDGVPDDGSPWTDSFLPTFQNWPQGVNSGKGRLTSVEIDGAWFEDKRGQKTFFPYAPPPQRVVRGGAVDYIEFICRIPRLGNSPGWWSPDTGFRLAMSID